MSSPFVNVVRFRVAQATPVDRFEEEFHALHLGVDSERKWHHSGDDPRDQCHDQSQLRRDARLQRVHDHDVPETKVQGTINSLSTKRNSERTANPTDSLSTKRNLQRKLKPNVT